MLCWHAVHVTNVQHDAAHACICSTISPCVRCMACAGGVSGVCRPAVAQLSMELRRTAVLRPMGSNSAGYSETCAGSCAGAWVESCAGGRACAACCAVCCAGVCLGNCAGACAGAPLWCALLKMPSTTLAMSGPMMLAAPGSEDRLLTVWARELTMPAIVFSRDVCDSCSMNSAGQSAHGVHTCQ
jgi:hypothetical protein